MADINCLYKYSQLYNYFSLRCRRFIFLVEHFHELTLLLVFKIVWSDLPKVPMKSYLRHQGRYKRCLCFNLKNQQEMSKNLLWLLHIAAVYWCYDNLSSIKYRENEGAKQLTIRTKNKTAVCQFNLWIESFQ